MHSYTNTNLVQFTEFPPTISHLAKLPSDYLCTILYKIVQYTRTRSTPLHKVYSLTTIPSLIVMLTHLSVGLTLPSPCKATRLLPRADAIVCRQHAYTQDSFKPLHKVYSLTTIPSLIALNVSKCRSDSHIILKLLSCGLWRCHCLQTTRLYQEIHSNPLRKVYSLIMIPSLMSMQNIWVKF